MNEHLNWDEFSVRCPAKPLLSKTELHELLGIGEPTLKRWVDEGRFPRATMMGYWTNRSIGIWMEAASFLIEDEELPEGPADDYRRRFVYFILSGDVVKIGIAADPEARLTALQTANPNKLELIYKIAGGLELERKLHRRFAHLRVRPDGEWFRYVDEIKVFIGGQG